jgi:hypothetical protein
VILEYVSPPVRDIWKTFDGFGTGDWQTFRATIEALYPSSATRYTKFDLEDFVDISTTSPVKNEEDVMLYYYRRFLQISNPLYNSEHLTDHEARKVSIGRLSAHTPGSGDPPSAAAPSSHQRSSKRPAPFVSLGAQRTVP